MVNGIKRGEGKYVQKYKYKFRCVDRLIGGAPNKLRDYFHFHLAVIKNNMRSI